MRWLKNRKEWLPYGIFQESFLEVTYKAWGVVIPHSLGVSKGLQQWVGTDDLILKRSLQGDNYCWLSFPKIMSGKEERIGSSQCLLICLHFAWLFLFLLIPTGCNCCKVLDDTLCVHSLPCSGFSAVKPKREAESVWSGRRSPGTQQPCRDLSRECTYVIRIDWFSRSGKEAEIQYLKLNEQHRKNEM